MPKPGWLNLMHTYVYAYLRKSHTQLEYLYILVCILYIYK